MTPYQQVIFKSRYARWLEKENRRENWEETVRRYVNFFKAKFSNKLEEKIFDEIYNAIYNMEVMPSMRALMTAGEALERSNIAGYNCSYLEINNIKAFSEILYILMNGTGVGFSVEKHNTDKLPVVPEKLEKSTTFTHTVEDSKEGWASALYTLISHLYMGIIIQIDYSKIRPAGARLKTFGGRASGPEPLKKLFDFIISVFENAKGRKLTPLECHDIATMTGEVVIVGGVRRSALISLSDLKDEQLRTAKTGEWWVKYPNRSLANNSAVYEGRPNFWVYAEEMRALYDSKSGERGIFNRKAASETRPARGYRFGTNPCGEIVLRPNQFCNLSEVVCRGTDTETSLKRKVKIATIIGTLQSTLLHFPLLVSEWKNNCAEERLLGVSLTGIMDCPLIYNATPKFLQDLKKVAIETNSYYAKLLGIPCSAAITCVKPSGTVSALVGSSSGIHPAYSRFYIRRIRQDNKDPLTTFLISQGVPHEECKMGSGNIVFSFPMKAPAGSLIRDDLTAIEHLEHWKRIKRYWCEHNPSITINIKEHEWPEVFHWVWEYFDEVLGISFLPYSDHIYQQAPYHEVSEDVYKKFAESMPKKLDWKLMSKYETEDHTVASQELACVGGVCEL